MFSDIVRWFESKVAPSISTETSSFFAPLVLDVESAGGAALTAVVQAAVNDINTQGHFTPAQMFQAGVDAGKKYLVDNGLPDLEHAVIGVAAGAVANLHAASIGASVGKAVTEVHEAVTVPPPVTEVPVAPSGDPAEQPPVT